MNLIGNSLQEIVLGISDFVSGYPLFLTLIGGGLFFLFYSEFVPFRYFFKAVRSLKEKDGSVQGQISSFEALASAIAATVGMGSIAGVAIALTMGGPGAIFWMWVSAVVGMASKFFEGSLAIMYKGIDSNGEVQGGPMYMITQGLGKKWKPMAIFFCVVALVGTLCLMQVNQLTESIMTVYTTPQSVLDNEFLTSAGAIFGWSNDLLIRFIIGVVICIIVSVVVLGGIQRIAKISSKIVPLMVALYFILVLYIILTNLSEVPGVFVSIFNGAFSFEAGLGGFVGVAIIGARRAAFVNEAGVGTASMMHGASKNKQPIREGLIAMLGPSIDSGLVCTLTALAILIAGNYNVEGIKGLEIAIKAFESAIPGYGGTLLMIIVLFFAFSTMFSYSYYGVKCSNYLFGASRAHYYNYFYLITIILAAVIPLQAVVGLMDLCYALMAFPTMITLLILSPKVKQAMKTYFK